MSSEPLFTPQPEPDTGSSFDDLAAMEQQFVKLHSLYEILKNVKDQISNTEDELNHCLSRISLEVTADDDVVFYPTTMPDKEVRLSRSVSNKWDIEEAVDLIAHVAHDEEREQLIECLKQTTAIDNRLFNKLPHGVRKHLFDALTTEPSKIKFAFKEKITHTKKPRAKRK